MRVSVNIVFRVPIVHAQFSPGSGSSGSANFQASPKLHSTMNAALASFCGPQSCCHRHKGKHVAHVGPCTLPVQQSTRTIFENVDDALREQVLNFKFDSKIRKILLNGGVEKQVMAALLRSSPPLRCDSPKKLPLSVCNIICRFAIPHCVKNFLSELRKFHVKEDGASISLHSMEPKEKIESVHSMNVFNNLFFAYAGPVAHIKLPRGVFFTGSLCLAAATIPRSKHALVGLIEALEPKVPDYLLHWYFEKRLGSGLLALINEFVIDYDDHVSRLNEIVGGENDYVEDEDAKFTALNWLNEEDGLGSYARADVDMIIVAKSDDDATNKVKETLAEVLRVLGDSIVVQTPNGLTIVPRFPMKHVQIITLWNGSLPEYLSFVDLDCTALAYDGRNLYGNRRSLLASLTCRNFLPPKMLFTRKDTPRRIGKYCRRGFGSFVASTMCYEEEELTKWAEALCVSCTSPGRFIGLRLSDSEHAMPYIEVLTGSAYTETRLPRGYNVTPKRVAHFLEMYQAVALQQGRRLITSIYSGTPRVGAKTKVKSESWWTLWGMA
jgi:hypothetical protein